MNVVKRGFDSRASVLAGHAHFSRRRLPAFALALVSSLFAAAPAWGQDMGIEVGAKAPAADVQTLDGKPANLSQYVGKKPVVIEFWATWCGNCKELEPALKAAHARYRDRVEFVAVAVSVNQSPELVRRYVARHAMPGVQLYDREGDATVNYDVPATSYVVVVDASGRVVYTGLGGKQDLEAAISRALR